MGDEPKTKDDLCGHEGDSVNFTEGRGCDEAHGEKYAYRHSGIQERHGTMPIWLVVVAIVLACWGVFYTIQNWNPPSAMY